MKFYVINGTSDNHVGMCKFVYGERSEILSITLDNEQQNFLFKGNYQECAEFLYNISKEIIELYNFLSRNFINRWQVDMKEQCLRTGIENLLTICWYNPKGIPTNPSNIRTEDAASRFDLIDLIYLINFEKMEDDLLERSVKNINDYQWDSTMSIYERNLR